MSSFFAFMFVIGQFSIKENMAPFTMCWKKTLTKLSGWLETCYMYECVVIYGNDLNELIDGKI